jgi:two-component system chemotaxis response regulator CheB
VILTGMGQDGAAGLKVLHDAGGPTLAQDEQSSAVFGMAKAAIELGAVDRVLPLEDIPRTLVELTG